MHVAGLAEDAVAMAGRTFHRFGLQRFLDGVEQLIASRAGSG